MKILVSLSLLTYWLVHPFAVHRLVACLQVVATALLGAHGGADHAHTLSALLGAAGSASAGPEDILRGAVLAMPALGSHWH